MTKVEYIIKASGVELSKIAVAHMLFVNSNNFVKESEIPDFNEEAFTSLVEHSIISASGNGFILSETGMQVLLDAADQWAEDTNPDLTVVKATRTKRGVTEQMETLAKFTEEQLISIGLDFKGTSEDRSNLIVKFKRVKTLKQIDIRRDGNIRVHAYNADASIVRKFEELGFQVKVGGKNTYIDNVLSEETIMQAINILKD